MTARQIQLLEWYAPVGRVRQVPRLVNLTVRLAMLQAELQDLRRDVDRAIENPLGFFEPGSDVDYAADEDDWGTAA